MSPNLHEAERRSGRVAFRQRCPRRSWPGPGRAHIAAAGTPRGRRWFWLSSGLRSSPATLQLRPELRRRMLPDAVCQPLGGVVLKNVCY